MNSTEPVERTTSALRSSESAEEINTPMSQLLGDTLLRQITLYLADVFMATSIFGVCSNSVNIVIFYKMGFSVVTNISLFCLAIVDLLSLFIFIIYACAAHPLIRDDYLMMSLHDISMSLFPFRYFVNAMGSWIDQCRTILLRGFSYEGNTKL